MVFIRVENIVIPIVLLFYNTPPELRLLNSSFLSSLFHISYVCCVKCESMLYVPKIRHVFYFSVSSNHAARNCLHVRWVVSYICFFLTLGPPWSASIRSWQKSGPGCGRFCSPSSLQVQCRTSPPPS
jgi:hypothetical protein